MDKLVQSAVTGLVSRAGEGVQIMDLNDEIVNLERDKWVQGVNNLLDKVCSYINKGASNSCSGIDTQYGDVVPDHPSVQLKTETINLFSTFLNENANPEKLLSMLTKYEPIPQKKIQASESSSVSQQQVSDKESCVCEKPGKNGGTIPTNLMGGGGPFSVGKLAGAAGAGGIPDVGKLAGAAGAGGIPDVGKLAGAAGAGGIPDVGKLAGAAGAGGIPDVGKLAGAAGAGGIPDVGKLAAAGAGGLAATGAGASAGGVANILQPGAITSSDSGKIIKTIVNTQGNYISCNRSVHDRIKKIIESIFRGSLKELNTNAADNLKAIFKSHIEYSRKKLNDERIHTGENTLKLFAPLFSIGDDKYKEFAINGYVHTLAEMYEYLKYREEYENGESTKDIIENHRQKIPDEALLKKTLKTLSKKHQEFANIMGGETGGMSISSTETGGTVFDNIMSMGGKKKRKRRLTKKRRKPRHNRTK
uniref:Uncharacterized protein n=1 Tax=viral metagenome TaxID=1070528 RepID=A0A6C0IN64_9ZZZZ